MGWSGHGLYDGDGTQSLHYDFIKTALSKFKLSEDKINEFVTFDKTEIDKKYLPEFKRGLSKVLNKIKKPKNIYRWEEYDMLEWQMLLCLCVDNNVRAPYDILVYGLIATHLLNKEYSKEYDSPRGRQRILRNLIKRVNAKYCTIKARRTIIKMVGDIFI